MKKTESVTYRTDKKVKSVLQQIAAEKKWSISQLSEEIIKQWLEEKHLPAATIEHIFSESLLKVVKQCTM